MEIPEIKAQLPLAWVLEHYGLKPDQHGRLHCPFHDDKIGTVYLYRAAQVITYHCFGCGDAGNAEQLPDGTYRLSSDEIRF